MIPVKLVQLPVGTDISSNCSTIIDHLEKEVLTIFPEGFLSGYTAQMDQSWLDNLDRKKITDGIEQIRTACTRLGAATAFGSLVADSDGWKNCGFLIGPNGKISRYDKVNLATHERGLLLAGEELPVWSLDLAGEAVTIGLQLCREVKYPEQWRVLSLKGAQVVLHLNNAIVEDDDNQDDNRAGHDDREDYTGGKNIEQTVGEKKGAGVVTSPQFSEKFVWQSQLVSRASENQRWVVSVNPPAVIQKSPTVVISPSGRVEYEAPSGPQILHTQLDLDRVSDWYLDQRATDVVDVLEFDN